MDDIKRKRKNDDLPILSIAGRIVTGLTRFVGLVLYQVTRGIYLVARWFVVMNWRVAMWCLRTTWQAIRAVALGTFAAAGWVFGLTAPFVVPLVLSTLWAFTVAQYSASMGVFVTVATLFYLIHLWTSHRYRMTVLASERVRLDEAADRDKMHKRKHRLSDARWHDNGVGDEYGEEYDEDWQRDSEEQYVARR